MSDDRTVKCARCEWRGVDIEAVAHAAETGHRRCIVCQWRFLGEFDPQVCPSCVQRVRDDLDAIEAAYLDLERVIGEGAWHGGAPGGDALAYAADGSLQRPMHGYETAEPLPHPLTHEDDEARVKPIRDEWVTDPLPVLAVLEANERDWRHEFQMPPAEDVATVANCAAFLRTYHAIAVRTHPGFDDYATELRTLRSRLEHVVGTADDPVRAPALCFDCEGQLVRTYEDRTDKDPGGLTDDWTCRQCQAVYTQPEYFLALRAARSCEGWVPVAVAAAAVPVPVSTLWRWVNDERNPLETRREGGPLLVEWSQVHERAEARRRSA